VQIAQERNVNMPSTDNGSADDHMFWQCIRYGNTPGGHATEEEEEEEEEDSPL